MRVLRAIVQAFVLAMFNLKAHLRPRRSVGAELVRDHAAGRDDRRFQKPLHEPLRRAGVSSTLDQDVENDAVLIDGAPEPVWLGGDRDDDLASLPYTYATKRSVDATGWQILERKARFIDAAMSGDGIVRVNS